MDETMRLIEMAHEGDKETRPSGYREYGTDLEHCAKIYRPGI